MISDHLRVFLFCFFYGFGESIRNQANAEGNLAFYAIGDSICSTRNIVYIGFIASVCLSWIGIDSYFKGLCFCASVALIILGFVRINQICPYIVKSIERNRHLQQEEQRRATEKQQ